MIKSKASDFSISTILILLSLLPLAESDMQTASLRGSLLYEQLAFRPITVNPQYFNFYRQFNISHILNALDVLTEFETLYSKLCKDIDFMPELIPEFINIPYEKQRSPIEACESRNAILPELRTMEEVELMLNLMNSWGIDSTQAGIDYVDNLLVYQSSKEPINPITKVRYCSDQCPLLAKQLKMKNETSFANHYTISQNVPHYRIVNNVLVVTPEKIKANTHMCMRKREVGLTALHFMLKSSCTRDTQEIKEQNRLLTTEISNFLAPNQSNFFFVDTYKQQTINPRHRVKRAAIIPLMSLFLLNGAVAQKSPLDALGALGASIFGLGSKQDMIITKQKLQEHATQISNLAINQETIVKAITEIQTQIQTVSRQNSYAAHKIAQAYAEIDNKGLIRHLQNLIQLTLLKMQTAINAATQAIPSPYVFSNKDLQNITHTFRMNDIMLTTNLNEISASVLTVDDQITFMFNVPVNDDRNKFHFYEVRQLPVFVDGKSYKIDIKHKHIGINDFTNEYILLSQSEFQRCLILPICILPTPFIRITDRSPCEILTYKDNIQTCPLIESLGLPPVFYTYKNATTYSIPKPIQIHITCKKGRLTQSNYKTISGMGTFDVTPGCTIHVPPDTNIRPEYMIGQEFMSSNTLTGTIREYTKDSAFLPLLLNVSTSTFKPLVLNEVKTFQQGVDLIFNHETLSTEVVRVIAYICIILIILWSLTCCFPKLKLWLKSFCLITKPEKYWGMRKYIIPSPFIRQNKTNENPPGDPLETYMSTFRQRLAKIINRPSESPSIEQPYKNDASDIEANNMTFGTLPGYRTQKP